MSAMGGKRTLAGDDFGLGYKVPIPKIKPPRADKRFNGFIRERHEANSPSFTGMHGAVPKQGTGRVASGWVRPSLDSRFRSDLLDKAWAAEAQIHRKLSAAFFRRIKVQVSNECWR